MDVLQNCPIGTSIVEAKAEPQIHPVITDKERICAEVEIRSARSHMHPVTRSSIRSQIDCICRCWPRHFAQLTKPLSQAWKLQLIYTQDSLFGYVYCFASLICCVPLSNHQGRPPRHNVANPAWEFDMNFRRMADSVRDWVTLPGVLQISGGSSPC